MRDCSAQILSVLKPFFARLLGTAEASGRTGRIARRELVDFAKAEFLHFRPKIGKKHGIQCFATSIGCLGATFRSPKCRGRRAATLCYTVGLLHRGVAG